MLLFPLIFFYNAIWLCFTYFKQFFAEMVQGHLQFQSLT